MTSSARFIHSFSLSQPEEEELQMILKKHNARLIDVIRAGINRYKYHADYEKQILKSRDAKLKK